MNSELNVEISDKEQKFETSEFFRDYFVKAFLLTVLSLITLITAYFNWLPGIILFIVLLVTLIIPTFLLNGLFVFITVFGFGIIVKVFKSRNQKFSLLTLEEYKDSIAIGLISGIYCFYLLLTSSLILYLFMSDIYSY